MKVRPLLFYSFRQASRNLRFYTWDGFLADDKRLFLTSAGSFLPVASSLPVRGTPRRSAYLINYRSFLEGRLRYLLGRAEPFPRRGASAPRLGLSQVRLLRRFSSRRQLRAVLGANLFLWGLKPSGWRRPLPALRLRARRRRRRAAPSPSRQPTGRGGLLLARHLPYLVRAWSSRAEARSGPSLGLFCHLVSLGRRLGFRRLSSIFFRSRPACAGRPQPKASQCLN